MKMRRRPSSRKVRLGGPATFSGATGYTRSSMLDGTTHDGPVTFQRLIAPGVEALRRYWRPFLFLQACALGLVIAFYSSDVVRDFCGTLSRLKESWGVVFDAVIGAIAGVALPEVAKLIAPAKTSASRPGKGDFLFSVLLFGGI